MPFCPVILEYADEYIQNCNPRNSRFMTSAYNTVPEKEIILKEVFILQIIQDLKF